MFDIIAPETAHSVVRGRSLLSRLNYRCLRRGRESSYPTALSLRNHLDEEQRNELSQKNVASAVPRYIVHARRACTEKVTSNVEDQP